MPGVGGTAVQAIEDAIALTTISISGVISLLLLLAATNAWPSPRGDRYGTILLLHYRA